MMDWIKRKALEQWVPRDQVVPVAKWSDKDRAFYLDSVAGLIKYKPKDQKDIARFRDKWVNRFEQAKERGERSLFQLYKELRSEERVKYSANLRTRLRGAIGL